MTFSLSFIHMPLAVAYHIFIVLHGYHLLNKVGIQFLCRSTFCLQCLLKGHTYFNKPVAESFRFVEVCVIVQWTPGTKGLLFPQHNILPSPSYNHELFFNHNKAGLFEGSFSWGRGGVNLTAPSYFKKNLSNIDITLCNC